MATRVQTGGTMSFEYSGKETAELDTKRKREIKEAYEKYYERRRRRKEKRNKMLFWTTIILIIIVIIVGIIIS